MKRHVIFKFISIIIILSLPLGGCGKEDTGSDNPTLINQEEGTEEEIIEEASSEELKDILEDYTYYHGIATVYEDQYWKSKYQDESHGEGNGVLTSEDYLVYDSESKKLYIIARNLTYNSQHEVTVNDLNGNYLKTANIFATGETKEYYFMGIKYKDKVSFEGLPVRMDGNNLEIYTRIETLDDKWVEYHSTADTVRYGRDRVMPPNVSTNAYAGLLPTIDELKDEKSYGNKDVFIYEATTRFWNLKGTFDYNYRKISLEEMMEGVLAIRDTQLNNESFSKRAELLPEVWQETASIGDGLSGINIASAGLSSIFNTLDDIKTSSDGDRRDLVEASRGQEEVLILKDKIKDVLKEQGDQSATRKLEGFVLETDEESLIQSYPIFYETVEVIYSRIGDYVSEFERAYNEISEANVTDKLEEIALSLRKLTDENNRMLELFEILGAKIEKSLLTQPLMGLDELYREWPLAFYALEGSKSEVNIEEELTLPLGYPKDIVPIVEDGKIIMVDVIPSDTSSREGYMITVNSTISEGDISLFYKEALKDLEGYSQMSVAGMTIIEAYWDDYMISILVTKNNLGGEEENTIQISIIDQ